MLIASTTPCGTSPGSSWATVVRTASPTASVSAAETSAADASRSARSRTIAWRWLLMIPAIRASTSMSISRLSTATRNRPATWLSWNSFAISTLGATSAANASRARRPRLVSDACAPDWRVSSAIDGIRAAIATVA